MQTAINGKENENKISIDLLYNDLKPSKSPLDNRFEILGIIALEKAVKRAKIIL